MARKKNKKVIRYRRPLNINIGVIIFLFIFLYLSFSVYTYMTKEKIQFYEVVPGSIVNDKEYTGIILRSETVYTTSQAGTVNFYVREGRKASVGTRIYSIDETGALAAYLEGLSAESNSLSDENLYDLKKQISNFSLSFSDMAFQEVYDIKYNLETAVLEYVNLSALDSLDKASEDIGNQFIQVRADQSGVVSYAVDDYSQLEPSQVNMGLFSKDAYERKLIKSGKRLEIGAPVFKLISDENWQLMFPMNEDDVTKYGGEDKMKLYFPDRDLQLTGAFEMVTGSDGALFGKVSFDKYMVQFVSDRFVSFEIVTDKVEGLKIPVSSVVTKNFYTVPVDYMTRGGDDSATGFLREVYTENGTSVEFVAASLYNQANGYYYLDTSEKAPLKAGDYIVMPDSTERYQIGPTAPLEGVYNINKGYAVFKLIDIKDTNGEYYTVKRNMSYGLSMYDHIVLDGTTVEEGQIVYQ